MRIVSISSVYPNRNEPGLGPFVRSRLLQMAKMADLVVVAPVPAIDYSNPGRKWLHAWRLPSRREDAGTELLHPRWAFPPGGTPANVLCLFLRLLAALSRLRRRFRFELIDAHFGYPEGVAAALLACVFRCPFTVTLRGSEPVFAAYRFRRSCLVWALRRAAAIFAVSGQLRQFAIECGADPARVRVVPNGVDGAAFYPRERSASREKFGVQPGRQVVVSAGELIEAKGHHLVIEAVRQLAHEGLAVDLYIAGGVARGGSRFDRVIAELATAQGEGGVRLLGWVDRETLAELMSAADVFCLASFTEGWPNVVHEALACGTPVVATRVGAVPEMLPGEQYGIVVPPREQAPLTNALRLALSTAWDRRAIARRGRVRSWEDAAREVVETMESLLPRADRLVSTADAAAVPASKTANQI